MALSPGYYFLRQSPALGFGGMYVTAGNVNEKIFTGARVPTLFLRQGWWVTPLEHKKDMYSIVLSDPSNSTGLGTIGAKVVPNVPVVLSEHPQTWRIVKSETTEVSDAYEIYAETCAGCLDLVVAVPENETTELKLVTLDSVKGNVPYFKFYRRSM